MTTTTEQAILINPEKYGLTDETAKIWKKNWIKRWMNYLKRLKIKIRFRYSNNYASIYK